MADQIEEVVEAEVVEETTVTDSADGATVLLSLEELIKTNIDSIEKIQQDLRKQREMFDDSFNNDPVFREHSEKVKEANKVKSQTKQQIMKQPSVMQLANHVKSMRQEIKERQASLSDYLQEYQRLSGATEIESNSGELLRIINSSKLKKEGSKK
jgi:hypothetical protein